MKEYVNAEMEIILIQTEDIIVTSNTPLDEDYKPFG